MYNKQWGCYLCDKITLDYIHAKGVPYPIHDNDGINFNMIKKIILW